MFICTYLLPGATGYFTWIIELNHKIVVALFTDEETELDKTHFPWPLFTKFLRIIC